MSDKIAVNVTSEIGDLERVLIHSPDGGIGNVPTSKIHDWLYDDIVDVEQMQKEYNYFLRILLLFLDVDKLFNVKQFFPYGIKFNPESENYFGEKDFLDSKVLDAQYCLAYIFSENEKATYELISSISAIEELNIDRKKDLEKLYRDALKEYRDALEEKEKRKDDGHYILGRSKLMDLTKTLITGKLELKADNVKGQTTPDKIEYIFPPVANFIFTRDTGVTIKDCVFITKPRFDIRKREVVLLKFITENYPLKHNSAETSEDLKKENSNIIEIGEDDDYFQIEDKVKGESRVSFEGGDIMMISENHILIGCSERTSSYAIHKFIHKVFSRKPEKLAELVSVIKISEKRSQMHIDTVLSHLKRDTWIMFGQLSEIWQEGQKKKKEYLFKYADSIRQKSRNELKKEKPVTITQFFCDGEYDEKLNYQVYTKSEVKLMKKRGEILDGDKRQSYEKLLKGGKFKYQKPKGLENLLKQISVNEFEIKDEKEVKIIYSGGGVSPHDEREQWTDACNLLVIREGIAVGYDRNRKTAEAFEHSMLFGVDAKKLTDGAASDTEAKKMIQLKIKEKRKEKIESNTGLKEFLTWMMEKYNIERRKQHRDLILELCELNVHLIHAKDLIDYFIEKNDPKENVDGNAWTKEDISDFMAKLADTLILLPSNELSRARGGSHCMSMPLWRKDYKQK